jgi:hypothetical protein
VEEIMMIVWLAFGPQEYVWDALLGSRIATPIPSGFGAIRALALRRGRDGLPMRVVRGGLRTG